MDFCQLDCREAMYEISADQGQKLLATKSKNAPKIKDTGAKIPQNY